MPGTTRFNDADSVESVATVFNGVDEENTTQEDQARGRNDNNEVPELGRNETKAVWRLKGLVVIVLIFTGIIIASMTFWITNTQEMKLFETQFQVDAERLKNQYYDLNAQRAWVATNIIIRYVAGAALSGASIQESAIFDFDYTGISQLYLSKSSSISFCPILTNETRADWELFAKSNQFWIDPLGAMVPSSDIRPVEDGIWQFSTTNMEVIDDHAENHRFVVPIWQVTPISLERRKVLFNSYSEPARRRALDLMMEYRQPTATKVLSHGFEKRISEQYLPVPRTVNFYPIFNSFSGLAEDTNVAAAIALEWRWDLTFQNVLQFEKNVFVVVENNCGQSFSFDIEGADAIYLGEGDHHDASFDRYKMITTNKETLEHFEASQLSFPPPAGFEDYISVQKIVGDGDAPGCSYTLIIYPTQRYLDTYATKRPAIFTFAVIMIFIFAIVVFAVYDRLVERRQSLVMDTAVKSSQIVNEFYPPEFVNRVIHPKEEETAREIPDRSNSSFRQRRLSLAFKSPVHSLQTFLTERVVNSENPVSKPIAEMFSECTILFADIAGFTAWASERDPIQVFELLEALYREFDSLAHRLGVFKVETIGDCYVAVVGLPVQNSAHAKIMSRFASKIHRVMRRLTQQLEVQLGPGTSDLKLRIGLHSGPVIAGVLRGEKPRFQLFGDSVNMTARMESTGEPGKTQVSRSTADLLVGVGKSHWLARRDQLVHAKGKGDLETFWMDVRENIRRRKALLEQCLDETSDEEKMANMDDNKTIHTTHSPASEEWANLSVDDALFDRIKDHKKERLIDWNTEMLFSVLSDLHSQQRQRDFGTNPRPRNGIAGLPTRCSNRPSESVRDQLRAFVTKISDFYPNHSFHNFEHACHVTLSSVKLLNRIMTPPEQHTSTTLHKRSFGISSDPLLRFVVVLSAVIHDVEHPGVPNSQLIKEQHPLALKYENTSIAENHSVELALSELMLCQNYEDLRECIFQSEEDRSRFCNLLRRAVLATDIMDKGRHMERQARWYQAFGDREPLGSNEISSDDMKLKASIVIEQIIQASDVAHTMQHWHIYCKWNEMLFGEMYSAYLNGRADRDPSLGWYEGELGFFDNYIIQLARKLKQCGVFGVSGDEYLQHALANRDEWEKKGAEITEKMKERFFNRAKVSYIG